MKKTAVILPHGRSQFRRVVRDENGNALKDESGAERVLLFSPGQPVELSGDELEAVRDDIGTALHLSKVDKDAAPVAKADGEATRKFVEETRKMREKQAADRNAAKAQVVEQPKAGPAPPKVAPAGKKDLESKDK